MTYYIKKFLNNLKDESVPENVVYKNTIGALFLKTKNRNKDDAIMNGKLH